MIATFTVINLIFKTIAFRHLVSNTFFVFFFKSICAFLKQSQSLVGIHPHRSRLKFTKGSWEEINSPTAHRLVLYVWNMSIWTVLLYHLLYFTLIVTVCVTFTFPRSDRRQNTQMSHAYCAGGINASYLLQWDQNLHQRWTSINLLRNRIRHYSWAHYHIM